LVAFLVGITSIDALGSSLVLKGKVLFEAGGCANCHTNKKSKGQLGAGGAAINTPYGVFFAPNITPDGTHGIGNWTDNQFYRAMREGLSPNGSNYFPVFPYTSYTNMTDVDLHALKTYIFTLKPVGRPNRVHKLSFPFNLRILQFFWKLLYFKQGPYKFNAARTLEWNRGAYLSRAVAHCGECHTPRNIFGGLDYRAWFSGVKEGRGPEGEAVPNIRSDGKAGIKDWSKDQIVNYLQSGEDPEGDYAGSLMFDVIDKGTENLSNSDREAIAVYLKDLPPVR